MSGKSVSFAESKKLVRRIARFLLN